MNSVDIIRDASFLKMLDEQALHTYYVKLEILDRDENPWRTISGQVTGGSISINGSSNIRRSGSITFVSEKTENDLTNIDNDLSINKKIRIYIGLQNNISKYYDDIIWFPQGIFVITQPNISHSLTGITISLSLKDKMCLLNGECGGRLPTSVTFDTHQQERGLIECEPKSLPSDPDETHIYHYKENNKDYYYAWTKENGWERSSAEAAETVLTIKNRIFDIIQTLVCNYGGEGIGKIIINDIPLELKSSVRFIGSGTLYRNTENNQYSLDASQLGTAIEEFQYNEDCGYTYTDFTYPGELVTSIGDSVTSVLDSIVSALGNYEYFYDIDGNFVFQEIKNYLNKSFDSIRKIGDDGFILSPDNYYVDFSNTSKSIYSFDLGRALISSYSSSPSFVNIKNDFHVWGKAEDGFAIHYHLAVKSKPSIMNTYNIKFDEKDRIKIAAVGEEGSEQYTPTDWRAELYLRGLEKKSKQIRPDIYEQELLDLFDTIYDMKNKKWREDIVNNANNLKYFIDFLEPVDKLSDISVDTIGSRIYSYQEDHITKLFNNDVPNVILISTTAAQEYKNTLMARCKEEGQSFSGVPANVYKNTAIGVSGYTAQNTMRELLYQYTDYNQSINFSSIPIYYIDANTRITVNDPVAGIYGDYIIKSINLPLDGKSQMSVSATKALERI